MMLLRVSIVVCLLTFATSFLQPLPQRRHSLRVYNSKAPVIINGQNLELTPSIVEYVNKRIGGVVQKLSADSGIVKECNVILSVSKNPKVENAHRIEVVALLKGTTIACHKASPDMYHSIDAAAHALNRKLRKYKENRVNGWHGTEKLSDDMMAAFGELEAMELPEEDANYDEFELLEDPEKPVITKVKSFDLENPIRLEEAIFALDYVDHDFYVFKNAETDKISVVYKRKVGGVGLIEP